VADGCAGWLYSSLMSAPSGQKARASCMDQKVFSKAAHSAPGIEAVWEKKKVVVRWVVTAGFTELCQWKVAGR
jgi:hypothetical protein